MSNFPESRLFQIAMVAYEAARAFDFAQYARATEPWAEANDQQVTEFLRIVTFHLDNPLAGDAGLYNEWLRNKEAEGWSWGKVYSEEEQHDPTILPFHLIPADEQARHRLLAAIVKALARV